MHSILPAKESVDETFFHLAIEMLLVGESTDGQGAASFSAVKGRAAIVTD
jgi:hypothetical protein